MNDELKLLRQLYRGPTLAETAERLAAQFAELDARPSLDRCDQMVRSLADAATCVQRLRSNLQGGAA